MDKNLSKFVKIEVSEQVALAAMFYFEQVFAFWMLINRNMLEWFLPIKCKEHTLLRSTNLFSRNHPTLFLLNKRRSADAPITESYFIKPKKEAAGGVL